MSGISRTAASPSATSPITPPAAPQGKAEATTASPGVITGAGGKMGKDQFLQLLVAQMKNQDPLNPMDGQQMAAQLAQFSSVEQLVQINETLGGQTSAQAELVATLTGSMALGAVGRQVELDPSKVLGKDGKPVGGDRAITGRVDGIRYTPQGPVLTSGDYTFPFDAIRTLKA